MNHFAQYLNDDQSDGDTQVIDQPGATATLTVPKDNHFAQYADDPVPKPPSEPASGFRGWLERAFSGAHVATPEEYAKNLEPLPEPPAITDASTKPEIVNRELYDALHGLVPRSGRDLADMVTFPVRRTVQLGQVGYGAVTGDPNYSVPEVYGPERMKATDTLADPEATFREKAHAVANIAPDLLAAIGMAKGVNRAAPETAAIQADLEGPKPKPEAPPIQVLPPDRQVSGNADIARFLGGAEAAPGVHISPETGGEHANIEQAPPAPAQQPFYDASNQLNIELKEGTGAEGRIIPPTEAYAALDKVGADMAGNKIVKAEGQPDMLHVDLNKQLTPEQGARLAKMLGQDAIPEINDIGQGIFHGPNKAGYVFDPKFFRDREGKPLAEATGRTPQPSTTEPARVAQTGETNALPTAGTSNRVNEATYGEGAVPSGKGVDEVQLLDDARSAVSSGRVDPYADLSKTRAKGIANPEEYAALAVEHERLVNDAVAKQKANDPGADEAVKAAEDFANAIQPHKTAASDLFRLFQGEMNYDLSTPFGMEQYMKAELGRGPKPREAVKMKEKAAGIRQAEGNTAQGWNRSNARVRNRMAKTADISIEDAAARVKEWVKECQI